MGYRNGRLFPLVSFGIPVGICQVRRAQVAAALAEGARERYGSLVVVGMDVWLG